jgi:hypothetical protein
MKRPLFLETSSTAVLLVRSGVHARRIFAGRMNDCMLSEYNTVSVQSTSSTKRQPYERGIDSLGSKYSIRISGLRDRKSKA